MSEMERRLAAADDPVASDEPEGDVNTVAYDRELQAQLLEHGPETLRQYGMIVVRGVSDPARYNAGVWLALAQQPEPLPYELKDGCLVITDPRHA